MTDAFAENPLITTVAVNSPDDPLDITDDCGNFDVGALKISLMLKSMMK